MRTTELRERLASTFHSESNSPRGRYDAPLALQRGIDWTSAYELADVTLATFKSNATIADLKHERILRDATPFFFGSVAVTCSCGGMDEAIVIRDGADACFRGHLAEFRDSS